MTVWLFRAGKQGEFENKFLEDGRSVQPGGRIGLHTGP